MGLPIGRLAIFAQPQADNALFAEETEHVAIHGGVGIGFALDRHIPMLISKSRISVFRRHMMRIQDSATDDKGPGENTGASNRIGQLFWIACFCSVPLEQSQSCVRDDLTLGQGKFAPQSKLVKPLYVTWQIRVRAINDPHRTTATHCHRRLDRLKVPIASVWCALICLFAFSKRAQCLLP